MSKQVPIEITVIKHGEVAVLQMSGTDNRINIQFCKKWCEALDKVESWPDVKALISTGSGKFYSNGIDLNFLASCSSDERREYTILFEKLQRRLLLFPMVTIAAINGHCFAGGVIMAFWHDYRIMHNGRGWMCLNEIDLGMRFPDPMRALFKAKFTPHITRDAVLFGYRFTALQAHDIGLIDEIAPAGEAVPKAIDMAINKTKNRSYSRDILMDMKSDLYGDIINGSNKILSISQSDETMFQSKL